MTSVDPYTSTDFDEYPQPDSNRAISLVNGRAGGAAVWRLTTRIASVGD
jgi:hypothetical protein